MTVPLPPGHILMQEWNIVIIEYNGDIIEKFLGLDTHTGRYRISSQILNYDPDTNTGRTFSGSSYQFSDKPGKLHFSAELIYEKLFNSPVADLSVSLKFPYLYDA